MKKLFIIFAFLLMTSPLWSHSIKFVAMDRYYNEEVPIDSILVHDMNTGEEKIYLTDSLFFETVSSVEELTKVNSLHLYPNPVEDILNINTNSSEIIISDISGKVHYKSSTVISGNVSLNVAGLPQGVYAIRTRNKSQTFIKNTPSNGQDIRLISTSSTPHSLVKEAEVQSQFDYRFTIYSDGFKPKNYYTKALTKDTVVELDMSTLTSPFDGKHIRVEFYIKSTYKKYAERRDITEYSSEGITTYIFTYSDTLVARDGIINMTNGSYGGDFPRDPHKINRLRFNIDTLEKTISNFYHLDSYKTIVGSQSTRLELKYESFSIDFYNEIEYTFVNNNQLIIDLKDSDARAGYTKEFTTVEGYGYERTEIEKTSKFIHDGSYIKIEFID